MHREKEEEEPLWCDDTMGRERTRGLVWHTSTHSSRHAFAALNLVSRVIYISIAVSFTSPALFAGVVLGAELVVVEAKEICHLIPQ